MALIERLTPGGNMYPDGSSTFAMLAQAFRRGAEIRDTLDASLLSKAKTEATTLANTARDTAVTTATQQAVAVTDARVRVYSDAANAEAAFQDAVGATPVLPAPVATVNFLTGKATQEGFPSFFDSQLSITPARRDPDGRAIVERASTNTVPTTHQQFTGAVVGVLKAGGSLPTGWSETNIDGTNVKGEILSVSGGKMTVKITKAGSAGSRDFAINMPARPGWNPGTSAWGGFTASAKFKVIAQSTNLQGVRLQQYAHTVTNGVTTTLRGTGSAFAKAGDPVRTLSTFTQVNTGETVNLVISGGVPAGQETAPWSVTFEVSELQSEAGQSTYDFTSYTTGAKPASTVGVHVPPGSYTALVQRGRSTSGVAPQGVSSNNGGEWHQIAVTGAEGWTVPTTLGTQYLEQIHVYPGTLTGAQKTAVSDLVAPVQYGHAPVGSENDFMIDNHIATLTTPEKAWSYKHATNRKYVERWEVRQGDHYAGDNPERPSAERAQRAEWMDYKTPQPWRVPIWHSMQVRIEPGLSGAGLNMPASLIIGQWHATEDVFNGTLEAQREPCAALWINNDNQVRFDTRWTDVQVMTSTTPLNGYTHWEPTDFPRGRFVHILQRIVFDWRPLDQGGIGRTEVWADGVKVVDVSRPIGYNDVLGPHWKQGAYRSYGTGFGRAVISYANTQWGTTDLSHLIGNPPPIS